MILSIIIIIIIQRKYYELKRKNETVNDDTC